MRVLFQSPNPVSKEELDDALKEVLELYPHHVIEDTDEGKKIRFNTTRSNLRFPNIELSLEQGNLTVLYHDVERYATIATKNYHAMIKRLGAIFNFDPEKPEMYEPYCEPYRAYYEEEYVSPKSNKRKEPSILKSYLIASGVDASKHPWHWSWAGIFEENHDKISFSGLAAFGLEKHMFAITDYGDGNVCINVTFGYLHLEESILAKLNELIFTDTIGEAWKNLSYQATSLLTQRLMEKIDDFVKRDIDPFEQNLDFDIDLNLSKRINKID